MGRPAREVAGVTDLPRTPAGHRRRSWWKNPAAVFAVLVLVVGLLAPLLANDVPWCARVAGSWSFPAFQDYVGTPAPGPGDLSWKQWWASVPRDADDFAIMPPWPYGPGETDPARFGAGPSFAHPLGNDATGRDVLSRLIHGAGTAIGLGGTAVLLGCLLGTLLGALAGHCRGVVDVVVMRLVEVFVCFPVLLFLLFASAFLGESRVGLVLVMASLFWTSFARIVRGELLALREREFVVVARRLGVPELRILFRHLLPLLRSQIGVTAAFCMASAIVAESTLSFLGLGPGQTASSWGGLLREGTQMVHLGVWHLWLFPTAVIVAVVMCCHVLADQLRARSVPTT
jgi:peptide/nickel transport system permease protein